MQLPSKLLREKKNTRAALYWCNNDVSKAFPFERYRRSSCRTHITIIVIRFLFFSFWHFIYKQTIKNRWHISTVWIELFIEYSISLYKYNNLWSDYMPLYDDDIVFFFLFFLWLIIFSFRRLFILFYFSLVSFLLSLCWSTHLTEHVDTWWALSWVYVNVYSFFFYRA